jgi:hypothetical protein
VSQDEERGLARPDLLNWDGAGQVWANSTGLTILREFGCQSLNDIHDFQGGEIVNSGGHRMVRRLVSKAGRTFFLKQSFRSNSGEVLSALIRHGKRVSSSETEARNIMTLASGGVSCGAVVAYGAEMKGLAEKFSFLLTEEVQGVELGVYLGNRLSSLPRSDINDTRVFLALKNLLVALIDGGSYFQDLVPKHIFIDSAANGEVQVNLIDVARIKNGKPRSLPNTVEMIAKLNVNLPLADVGTAYRARFTRTLGHHLNLELMNPVIRASEALLRRRRYRFVLSPHPRPAELQVRHMPMTGTVWDRAQMEALVDAKVDLETKSLPMEANVKSSACFLGLNMSHAETKMLVNLHRTLRGWIRLTPLAGWRMTQSDGEPSWAMWQASGKATLAEKLSTLSDQELPRFGLAISQIAKALLMAGVIPEADWCSWMRWESGEIRLEPKPPFRTKDLNADMVTEELQSQISAIIGLERAKLVLGGFSLERPALLGGSQRLIRS